jgi:hypothetical protein
MAARGPRLQGILQVDGLHIRRHAAHVDAPRLDRRQLRARCCPEVVEGWVTVGFWLSRIFVLKKNVDINHGF